MKLLLQSCVCAAVLLGSGMAFAQEEEFDYFAHNRELIRNGVQAVLQCNGLFTSHRTPAPATRDRGNFYGGQWWLVPDDVTDVPGDAYSTAGNRGQYVIVVPSHELVIVRRGLDYGKQGFDRWDLLREVLKAFDGGP